MRMAVPVLASLTLVVHVACGGGGADCATSPTSNGCTGGGSAPIVGNYTLKLVDGKAPPAVFADSSLESGTLVVTDSGWVQTTVVKYRVGGSGNPNGDTLSMGGGWRVTGSSVELLDGNSTAYTGTLTSTSLTLTTKTATILGYSK